VFLEKLAEGFGVCEAELVGDCGNGQGGVTEQLP
jgi:hypothetical protein